MTEADAATKAPESDAHEEEAGVHAPTPASQSAGEHCVSDRPTREQLIPLVRYSRMLAAE